MMKTLLAFSITVISLLILNSCDTNEALDDLTPGRRDYTWTVDTLNGINNPRYRMWGNSLEDIWATTGSDWKNSFSHFDGNNWKFYGVTNLINANAIYGFSASEIYAGAENGQIWKYGGDDWNLFTELAKDDRTDIVFSNIWGESSSDFYASGAYPDEDGLFNESVIAHFVNGSWDIMNTDDLFGIVSHIYKNFNDNKIYLIIIGGTNYTDSTKIYEYTQNNYNLLYGNLWTKGLQADISLINNTVYFVMGNQIAIRVNNNFKTIVDVNNSNFYQRIWGRNSKDIFLLMTDGLAHYNGSDIEYLFYFPLENIKPWTQIYGAALFEKDVFFLVSEPPTGLSLVYHGKLN